MERPSPIPSHLVELTTPEHTAWQGFFAGFNHAARRSHVSPRRFQAYASFPYETFQDKSLVTITARSYQDNPVRDIHNLLVNVWQGRRWTAIAAATGILINNNLNLTQTTYVPDSRRGFSQEEFYTLLGRVGGILEQPQEYQIYPNL